MITAVRGNGGRGVLRLYLRDIHHMYYEQGWPDL